MTHAPDNLYPGPTPSGGAEPLLIADLRYAFRRMPLGAVEPPPRTTPGHTLQRSFGLLPSTGEERFHSRRVWGAYRDRLRSHTSPAYAGEQNLVLRVHRRAAQHATLMTDVNSSPSRVPRTPILNNPEGGFVPPVGGYSGATARHYPDYRRGRTPAPPDPPATAHNFQECQYNRTSN